MKTMPIDAFLTWAFVHELAKGGGAEGVSGSGSAWSQGWRVFHGLAELGTRVDTSFSTPVEHDTFILEQSGPHPDAVKAGEAVRALSRCAYAIEAGMLAGDWAADAPAGHRTVIAEAAELAAASLMKRKRHEMGRHIVGLVINRAILGLPPFWDAAPPKIDWKRRANAAIWYVREARGDGARTWQMECEARRDPKTHRYPAGAYRKLAFEFMPIADLAARGDWLLWVCALRRVAASLALAGLQDHRISGIGEILRPWDGGPTSDCLVDFS